MRAVGIKTLKNRLSEYIRLVSNGETVLVTDRDRVVAELTPPRPSRSQVLGNAMLADAVRRGWVTGGLGAAAAQAHYELPRTNAGFAARPGRPVIYLDTSIALAHVLAEDRSPRNG